MYAGWSTGWQGSNLTIRDSSNTLLLSSAGPEEYYASEQFCYAPGESYNFSVSEIQGWYYQSEEAIADSIIKWQFGEILVYGTGDESVTTFVGPVPRVDVSCVSFPPSSSLYHTCQYDIFPTHSAE